MYIKNKEQSTATIKRLGLNRVEEKIFRGDQAKEIRLYLNETGFASYGIRDKDSRGGGGCFKYGVNSEDVMQEAKRYSLCGICESLIDLDKENLVLQGEILVTEDAHMIASLSTMKGRSNREAMKRPPIKIDVSLLRRSPKVQGLNQVLDYVFKYRLFGVVVEFSLYDCPVGVNRENLIVWELRNY